jgi:hypothetical protein
MGGRRTEYQVLSTHFGIIVTAIRPTAISGSESRRYHESLGTIPPCPTSSTAVSVPRKWTALR